jgi:hypothetical protein
MEQEDLRMRRASEILGHASFDIAVSNDPLEAVRATCFTPHALASSSVRK